jgi:hypothetical protein
MNPTARIGVCIYRRFRPEKEPIMRRFVALMVVGMLALTAAPALADIIALDVDAQAGYAHISNISDGESRTLSGGTFGFRAKLNILFLCAIVDYQRFFNNADFAHLGLGGDFKLPLSVVEPYIRGSLGVILLTGPADAFDPARDSELEPTGGFQVRAGAGLDIPLGDWFAVGVCGDVGYHFFPDENGIGFSVVGYLGLRI